MDVITAAAETRAAATAMGVLFFEMMFRGDVEAIARKKRREQQVEDGRKSYIRKKDEHTRKQPRTDQLCM